MNLTAIKKAASSSKVLIFLVFATAITVALKLGMVESAWYQETIANGYYLLMGGYSIVEIARSIYEGKIAPEKVLEDPKKALDDAKAEKVDAG